MHQLKFMQAEEADSLMIATAKVASDAQYLKRFKKNRDGAALGLKMIDDLSKHGKEVNDELYATGQALKA